MKKTQAIGTQATLTQVTGTQVTGTQERTRNYLTLNYKGMKIFISMPMKSKSTEQVRTEMNKVFQAIKQKLPEAELIDSIIDGADSDIAVGGDDKALWYLGKSIIMLAVADIVFFVNNWADYRGCSVERKIATEYGKFCVDIKVNL